MSHGRRPKILVVYPDPFDRQSFGALEGYEFLFAPDAPSHWSPDPRFDPLAYFDHCLRLARDSRIDAVVSTHDLGDLIASMIARELQLPGPTPEEVFLTLHKYYARLREQAPVRCETLDLHDRSPALQYPVYLKPPWLKLGLLGFKLENDADRDRALAIARRDYPAWARQYTPLFQQAIDRSKYPLATAEVMLVEEFIDGPQVTVEGWMHHGSVHLWAITDTNTFEGSRVIDNFSLPSRRSPEQLAEISRFAIDEIHRSGFDDGFFNLELWETASGLRLTEVNGRGAVSFAGLYRAALGANIFAAIARLACGEVPSERPTPTGLVAGQFNLIAFGEAKIEELVDFEAAARIPELVLFHERGDHVRPVSEFGVVLGQIELSGSSYEEIQVRAKTIRKQVLHAHGSEREPPRGGRRSPIMDSMNTAVAPAVIEVVTRALALAEGDRWPAAAQSEILDQLRPLQVDARALVSLLELAAPEGWPAMEIGEGEGAHATLFALRRGQIMPLHDHPSMTVISKVLFGSIRVRTLVWSDPASHLARDLGERIISAPDEPQLIECQPGTLHAIEALEDCAFLDLFSRWYSNERECSYFVISEGAPSGSLVTLRPAGAGTR